MISRDELGRIARAKGLSLYQQEKDYLLKLFLYHLYRSHKDAVFKGGTCIRYLYGLQRFSEDLDFTVARPKRFKEQVARVLRDIGDIGIRSSFLKEESFPDAYACEIGFEGPLYKGTAQTRNKFAIDAGKRQGIAREPAWKIIHSEYPETGENFLVLAMAPEELLAEKTAAALTRGKGRDLYDVWFLLSAGITLDRKLLARKGGRLDVGRLPGKAAYERDLSRLTPTLVPYGQVIGDIRRMCGDGQYNGERRR